MTTESAARDRMAMHGRSLYDRGLCPGTSGNLSVKLDDGLLVTPTNCCLGRLDPARISKLDWDGRLMSGEPPSKEGFLHLTMYRERQADRGVVHLHCTAAVAVSCLADVDPADVLPPLTAYYLMRVGTLPLVPYFKPGDRALAEAVGLVASKHHAVLLANHGPVLSGRDLETAVSAMEELEETARLYFLLRGFQLRLLTPAQVDEIRRLHPS